jgi:hypothetical protein
MQVFTARVLGGAIVELPATQETELAGADRGEVISAAALLRRRSR